MTCFERIVDNIYLLKIPFGPVWTGVVLVRGKKNILIDSGATSDDVDNYLVPALAEMGLGINDIHYLTNTHSHGDHIGGHARLRQLGNFSVVCYRGSQPKVENPVPYAIATGDKGTVCVNPTEKQRRKMRKTNNRNSRLKIQL